MGPDPVLDPHQVALPEEMFQSILKRLPLSARCRCRCVCQKWKRDLLAPPYQTPAIQPACSCMIFEDAKAFCHSKEWWISFPSQVFPIPSASDLLPSTGTSWEKRNGYGKKSQSSVQESVFTIPSNVNQSSRANWVLVDVDGGLLCYERAIEGSYWLCVSNPLTSSFRVIPPDYYHHRGDSSGLYMQKLLVDQRKKTFKVVLVLDRPRLTAVYDSTTSCWLLCCHPGGSIDTLSGRLFVWKNIVYAHNSHNIQFRDKGVVKEFNMESGGWANTELSCPGANGYQHLRDYFFLSDKDQLVLVQFSHDKRSSFYVWKLLDDGSIRLAPPLAPFSRWKKFICGRTRDIGKRIGENLTGYGLYGACLGPDYMCFQFEKNGFPNTSRDESADMDECNLAYKCVKYSFAAKKWSLVPGYTGWARSFHWEPSVDMEDMDPSSLV